MWLRRRYSWQSERGATIVEAALATPLLFLLITAVFEFGLTMRTELTVDAATREAARTLTTLGSAPDSDYRALRKIAGRLEAVTNLTVTRIVVFNASTAGDDFDAPLLASCLGGSVAGVCSSYSPGALTAQPSQFQCAGGALDASWCPAGRKNAQTDPPDLVGVYIVATQESATSMFGSNHVVSSQMVMRIEPTEHDSAP